MEAVVGPCRIRLIQGDITQQHVDAIVNAANARLQLGSGVAGAIARRGGPAIQAECDGIGGTPVGSAVITTAGELSARFVIHAVGPRMGEGDEDEKLRSAVLAALIVAEQHELPSVALPAISTGIFGYPLERCARISVSVALDQARKHGPPTDIRFVLFDPEALAAFRTALSQEATAREDVEVCV